MGCMLADPADNLHNKPHISPFGFSRSIYLFPYSLSVLEYLVIGIFLGYDTAQYPKKEM